MKSITKIRRDFESHVKSVAVKGENNIKSELQKSNKDAIVTTKIDGNKVKFIVEPKRNKIDTEKLSAKDMATTFKAFKDLPIELLNEALSQDNFSVDRETKLGLRRTQKSSDEWVKKQIKKLI